MKKITGAKIVLETLKYLGVKDIFGYPGGAVIPIYDALYDFKGINHYMTRHEQGAVHSADGYARTKKVPGVCLATSGPGATNLVTGIMTAHMDSIPLLVVTGQVSTSFLGKDSFQESDIIGITSPITKNNYLVRDICDLPEILKEAYTLSKHGRPGPVLVDIPKNIQEQVIDYSLFEILLKKDIQE
ncbi:thiamine pyrophosphate-binding protein, partial [Cetobacterium sp.]|uniref:thiamine pyrophosphate-binding protein n=1 Tax=Cetobacterium sp. TaxID=2071632 RepID=UPI003F39AB25